MSIVGIYIDLECQCKNECCIQGHWCVALGVVDMQVEGQVEENDIIIAGAAYPRTACKGDPNDPAALQRALAIAMNRKTSPGDGWVKALVLLGLDAAHALRDRGSDALSLCLDGLVQRWIQTDNQLRVCVCSSVIPYHVQPDKCAQIIDKALTSSPSSTCHAWHNKCTLKCLELLHTAPGWGLFCLKAC